MEFSDSFTISRFDIPIHLHEGAKLQFVANRDTGWEEDSEERTVGVGIRA